MKGSNNQKTVTVKITRSDLCHLMMACTLVGVSESDSTKWRVLHEKLESILNDFDQKQEG